MMFLVRPINIDRPISIDYDQKINIINVTLKYVLLVIVYLLIIIINTSVLTTIIIIIIINLLIPQ